MSTFEVKTHTVTIQPHPDADRIELARIGDFYSVVPKGQLKDGDVAAYIPEASIVPDSLLEKMELTGKLAGPSANRVHAQRFRGVLSQGLVLPMPSRQPGEDVADELGITKWEPIVPAHMQGEMEPRVDGCVKFPVENIKAYPDMFQHGEEIILTEKIHGTWCCLGRSQGQPLVTSIGMSEQRLAFIMNDANKSNLYVRQWLADQEKLAELAAEVGDADFHVLGEIYGHKVQDIQYNLNTQEFRVFDILVDGKPQPFEWITQRMWDTVPLVYRGPYNKDLMLELTSGPSLLPGANNSREGIVIRAVPDSTFQATGERKLAKSLSPKHLLRKGGTEYR